ncbi:kinase-like domain-containing protein [Annulohypoxylon maeteangense]|uniref:kinase-like domain-containing protein n=1 Tax=Annulohypoxylon maeteangense TaxID=1927788 RepID=UPI002008BE29|nr:kinase-like domain-containing protein [Annulohypoxylon maeteangense]KAI0882246.1 kinase-like domain-containing protein [Annulohypoxylon maeteangense]
MTENAPLLALLNQRLGQQNRRNFERAKAAGKKLREEFGQVERLKYQRVLGYGGFGIVQLWHLFDQQGNFITSAAIKYPTRENHKETIESTRWEMEWMGTVFRNMEHFVQLVDIETDTREVDRLTNSRFVANPILVMEALSKCTAYELISWTNDVRAKLTEVVGLQWSKNDIFQYEPRLAFIPNRVLWRLFYCLVKGVTGMAWPANDGHGNLPPLTPTPIPEKIPPLDQYNNLPPQSTIIHFDLDPKNVLLGDRDFGEHEMIADFGLMIRWDDRLSHSIKRKRIRRGKPSWYAPEQKYPDRATSWEHHVGQELNVWAIGLIMFNLMTLRHPSEPWAPYERLMLGRDSIGFVPVLTWGSFLMEPPPGVQIQGSPPFDELVAGYDFNLRQLIARCMADATGDRPTISELSTDVLRGIVESDNRKYFWANYEQYAPGNPGYNPLIPPQVESDELVAKWYNDYFVEPPPNPDRNEGNWSE